MFIVVRTVCELVHQGHCLRLSAECWDQSEGSLTGDNGPSPPARTMPKPPREASSQQPSPLMNCRGWPTRPGANFSPSTTDLWWHYFPILYSTRPFRIITQITALDLTLSAAGFPLIARHFELLYRRFDPRPGAGRSLTCPGLARPDSSLRTRVSLFSGQFTHPNLVSRYTREML